MRADLDRVRDEFVLTTQRAHEAGFDILQLNFAQGYLLASFISPLTNHRKDEYGGDLEHRMRFPLEIFDAVRATWPQDKPISVTLTASDCAKGGFEVHDAVTVARMLKEHGCDIIAVVIGQTTIDSEPAYGRGSLTPFSDRIRNEAGILTMVGGYLTTSDEVNTIIAAGRRPMHYGPTAIERSVLGYYGYLDLVACKVAIGGFFICRIKTATCLLESERLSPAQAEASVVVSLWHLHKQEQMSL